MRCMHRMPFGAEPLENGTGVRFRLWAPAAGRVLLSLETESATGIREIAMEPEENGWFCRIVDDAGPGDRYRYRINGGMTVPDPASRYQPDDVHGASAVVAPLDFDWSDCDWHGRPWEETVLYELHAGAFTPGGRFADVSEKLSYLAGLGVTAIELMPVADAPGARNWGYDGAYPFAPEASFGRPEALKALIAAAHGLGLMVFLDVVYNHFGPEGNYLHLFAPSFFTERHHTPWGAALNFDGPESRTVRDFFIHNALYWIEEYRIDGLRLDAVHAIVDDSEVDILSEIAETVRHAVEPGREVHLVLENDANEARCLGRGEGGRPILYTAQWNDDAHHALHVLLTGEKGGYYEDYAKAPAKALGRALAEGFAYQGEPSQHRRNVPRGTPSAMLPPVAFVCFLQNHDQVGNRAFGERIDDIAPQEAVCAALAVLLLAPAPPLLFMGEEWGTKRPFPFFCDFGPDLADSVREGRRNEFAHFPQFRDPAARESIPDPLAEATFLSAVLDWSERDRSPHAERLELVRRLLALRREEIVPRLAGIRGNAAAYEILPPSSIAVAWRLGDGSSLHLLANLSTTAAHEVTVPAGRRLHVEGCDTDIALSQGRLPPWSVAWLLEEAGPRHAP